MTTATGNTTTVSQPIGSGLIQQGSPNGGLQNAGTANQGTTNTAYQNPQAAPYGTSPVGGEPINAFQSNQPSQFSGIPNYPQAGPNQSAPSFGSLQQPWAMNSSIPPVGPGVNGYTPRVRDVPIDVILSEGQTGRIVLGGSVNTDLGVAGQVIVEERNFDIRKFPRSFRDMFNGAFRGNGENFRLELVPGNQVQRYTVNWTQPNLFGYSPYSLSVGGFLFNRIYRDWSEQRLGGRVALGYEITPDLSISSELRGENVDVYSPRITGLPALDSVVGGNELYTGRFRLAHNTRDSPFLPTEGHFLELIYDQVFGSFDYPRGQINYSRYFMLRERADGTGRHTLTNSLRFGVTGAQTPIYENFFAGGYTTLRGFRFRGAGPVESGIQTGGQLMFLGTLEYMFPLSADDMIRMVAFVDYGTVERTIRMDFDNFRIAPGLGFRVAVPAMGPAPLAFDFAVPVQYSPDDERQVFSFSVGITR
jgi:outer membrane protein insertion porin family